MKGNPKLLDHCGLCVSDQFKRQPRAATQAAVLRVQRVRGRRGRVPPAAGRTDQEGILQSSEIQWHWAVGPDARKERLQRTPPSSARQPLSGPRLSHPVCLCSHLWKYVNSNYYSGHFYKFHVFQQMSHPKKNVLPSGSFVFGLWHHFFFFDLASLHKRFELKQSRLD